MTTAIAPPTLSGAPHSNSVVVRARWAVSDTWTITKRNLLAVTRIPEALFFSTVQPIMFVLLFRYVFGGAIKTPGVDYVCLLYTSGQSRLSQRQVEPPFVQADPGVPSAGQHLGHPVERQPRRTAEDEKIPSFEEDVGPRPTAAGGRPEPEHARVPDCLLYTSRCV